MGNQSVVSGYIEENGSGHEQNRIAIAQFEFDEKYPFSNIFWCDSPATYGDYVIGFTGIYKQIEEDWNEWLWKFSRLLSTLDASDAFVHIDCILGAFYWRLMPLSWHLSLQHPPGINALPPSFRGEQWGVYEASENDFSLMSPWVDAQADEEAHNRVPRWIV